MNFLILIARNQFLLAKRALTGWQWFYLVYLDALFGFGCFYIPFHFLFIFAVVAPMFLQSTLSTYRLRASYEIDAGILSIYPLSRQKRFGLLLLIDLLHINGFIFITSFIMLAVAALIHFSPVQTFFLLVVYAAYWLFFSALNLCMRTFARRNFTYYYFFQATSSFIIIFYFLFAHRKDTSFISFITAINPLYFMLCSVAVLGILYLVVSKWFSAYLLKHPFANPELAQKFITRRWR